MKLIKYCVKHITEDRYLNYAKKKKKIFSDGFIHNTRCSCMPTLRNESHLDRFREWIANTSNPKEWIIVKWTMMES